MTCTDLACRRDLYSLPVTRSGQPLLDRTGVKLLQAFDELSRLAAASADLSELSGRAAVVVKDDVKVEKMWRPYFRAWFPEGVHDPEIVLVALRVARAEYWLVPRGLFGRWIDSARAMATGRLSRSGRHGVLDLHPAAM